MEGETCAADTVQHESDMHQVVFPGVAENQDVVDEAHAELEVAQEHVHDPLERRARRLHAHGHRRHLVLAPRKVDGCLGLSGF